MKKAILVTLTLCYICGILCSCNSNTAQITYDSTNQITVKLTAKNSEIAKENEQVLNVDKQSLSAVEMTTDINESTTINQKYSEYKNNDGKYTFNGNRLITYIADSKFFEEQITYNNQSEGDIKKNSYEIFRQYTSHPEDYKLEYAKYGQNYYSIAYYYMVNDIKTNDFVLINMKSNGKLLSLRLENLGLLNGVKIPEFDESNLRKQLEEALFKTAGEKINYTLHTETTRLEYDKSTKTFSMRYDYEFSDGGRYYKNIPVE